MTPMSPRPLRPGERRPQRAASFRIQYAKAVNDHGQIAADA
jgi:hypothetical protein